MDYNTMTPDILAEDISSRSGYSINKQDCKSRIENCCIKFAYGDFEINGIGENNINDNDNIVTIKSEIQMKKREWWQLYCKGWHKHQDFWGRKWWIRYNWNA